MKNYRNKLAQYFFAKMVMSKYCRQLVFYAKYPTITRIKSFHFVSMTNFKEAKNFHRHRGALPRKYCIRVVPSGTRFFSESTCLLEFT